MANVGWQKCRMAKVSDGKSGMAKVSDGKSGMAKVSDSKSVEWQKWAGKSADGKSVIIDKPPLKKACTALFTALFTIWHFLFLKTFLYRSFPNFISIILSFLIGVESCDFMIPSPVHSTGTVTVP